MNSTFKIIIAGIFAAMASVSCQTATVVTNPDLKTKPLNVKGKIGLLIGQVITFGNFKTDKVRRGWTRSYYFPFFIRFVGAKEKLSFQQFNPRGKKATISCVSKLNTTELSLADGYFELPQRYKNLFVGNIILENNHIWNFVLYNPDGDIMRNQPTTGIAENGTQKIEIKAIRGLGNQPKWIQNVGIYGFEFYQDGKIIGAVSTLNQGQVWIEENLNSDTELVLAALSSSLILRSNLEEHISQ